MKLPTPQKVRKFISVSR